MSRKSKSLVLAAGFLTLLFFGSGLCQSRTYQRKPKTESKVRLILHYGNLTGAGLGLRLSPKPWFGFELLAGTEVFKTIILASPYPGNVANLVLRMRVCHPWGFYAVAGAYGGMFDFSKGSEDYLDPLYKYQAGPVFSLGFEFPGRSRGKRMAVEAGMVLNLSKELVYTIPGDLEIYDVVVKRSHPDMGGIFPFFLVQFNF